MSLKRTVMIQSKSVTYDAEGMPTTVWSDVQNVEGTLLPFGNKLALQEYGFTEDVKYRFFYKGSNANLIVGNRIIYGSLELPIVYVADYSKAMDVLLNTTEEQLQQIGG
jgi:hypothetical protein